MNTKKLKQLVLDLAIHGKLVPQDPNDEPASELLKRIVETHGRASNIGRASNKKSAISSDNLDDVPFEVPEGWVWCTVKDICSKIGSGSTPRGSNYSDEGIPFFRSQNVYNEGLVYDDIKYISEETHLSMIGTEVKAKDILLNITGGSLGRCALVPNDFKRGNVSQHVCILRTIEVLHSYLHFFIISDFFSDTMILSGSGREGLPKYSLEAMPIPLPPLSEQKRIVAEVEKWFGIIDQLESNEADLRKSIEQTKKKVLDLAIHGKLVPQDPNDEPASELLKRIVETLGRASNKSKGKKSAISSVEIDEVPFEVPKGWCWCTLSDVAQSNIGLTYKPSNVQKEGVPVLRSNNIKNRKLCLDDLVRVNASILDSQFLCEGDILICARNGSRNLVGKCAIIENLSEPCSFGAFMAICRSIINPWVFQILNSVYFSKYLDNSNSTTIFQVTQKMLLNLPIPLPPLSEQKRIVRKIEEVFGELDRIVEMIG